ncbi:glycosyltransferase [Chloroflexota bacterium]
MIDKTVIVLAVLEDYSKHKLLKHVGPFFLQTVSLYLYFCKPLQRIFSKVIVYDFLKRMTEIGVKATNKEIIDLVRKEHADYVVWVSWQYEIQESTFESIRKEGTIVVGWFHEDEVRFDNYSKWWIPYVDYCVTNDIRVVSEYRKLGARVLQTIPFTGIPINRDWLNIEEYEVTFVGTRRPEREQYINELTKKNIPIHLFGEGWGKYVSFEEMVDIFRASKININFSRVGGNDKLQIKGRIFEICMAGGFILTEYVPGIERYFEIDKEIACFRDADEMIGKIIYYLNHDKKRQAMAQSSWKRATSEYASLNMLSKTFNEIEEDIATKGKESALHSQELRMSVHLRKSFSDYYLKWGIAFLIENYKGLWKDALSLSTRYYPLRIRAWFYYIIGFFPYSVRSTLIKLYRGFRLSCMPYLRKIKNGRRDV